MMPHQEDIARYLVTQAIGAFGGNTDWSIHVNVEPANPDRVITLYATTGFEPDTDELDLLQLGFQVRTRTARLGNVVNVYREAFEKQEAIRDLLILTQPIITANSTFLWIMMDTEIQTIGRDELDRHLIVTNYRAVRQRV